jgi:hydroxymethylbilane synthase
VSRRLVVGARGSALSRIQARLVGAALQREHPGLEVQYAFTAAPADLPYVEAGEVAMPAHAATPIGTINRGGGFALHLHEQLEAGAIDVAVHSWKDLPLPGREATTIAATLPRADARDVLVFSNAALARLASGADGGVLHVLSCSARRRTNLRPFLDWALPFRPAAVEFPPVRGDIERRLGALLSGQGHALVVAKAALDRMLAAPSPEFDGTRARVRAALEQCRIMVVPLVANPAAPGQGALAIEVRRDRGDLQALLEPVNDLPTFRLVQQERARLATLGDDDTPVGITALDLGFGDVEFVGGEFDGRRVDAVDLHRHAPLPRPRRAADVWCGDAPGADPFRRVPLDGAAPATAPDTGLLVARADALPPGWTPHEQQCVWTPGLATWRKLAARGVWVNGSDESLGETAAADVRHLFPSLQRWTKLSHDSGFDPGRAELLPTYRLERVRALLPVHGHTHFFWNSGSQFLEYLRAWPGLERAALHGSGPGNTLRILRATLGEARVRPFLGAAQFRAELCA